MERYDYLANVIEDVKEVVVNEYDYKDELLTDHDGFEQRLNDELWTKDSVTGNGSGSYTFNAWQAEENLCHNLDLLGEALDDFECETSYLEKGAEACDVTIRCYLLRQAIASVLDDLEAEIEYEDK